MKTRILSAILIIFIFSFFLSSCSGPGLTLKHYHVVQRISLDFASQIAAQTTSFTFDGLNFWIAGKNSSSRGITIYSLNPDTEISNSWSISNTGAKNIVYDAVNNLLLWHYNDMSQIWTFNIASQQSGVYADTADWAPDSFTLHTVGNELWFFVRYADFSGTMYKLNGLGAGSPPVVILEEIKSLDKNSNKGLTCDTGSVNGKIYAAANGVIIVYDAATLAETARYYGDGLNSLAYDGASFWGYDWINNDLVRLTFDD